MKKSQLNLMKKVYSTILISTLSIFCSAQNDTSIIKKFIKKTDISAQWFLAYTYDKTEDLNYFNLKRGYFTIKTDLNPSISVRYTQDIELDKEGSDAGNVEIRMKYLYMKVFPFKSGFLKNASLEFGLVHRPWLEFEQKINDFRVQGKMYIENIGIFNSADFGITISGLIGKKLSPEIQKKVGNHYPGRYGSYSFGIYNGPGYHDNEFNNNKVFESRISIRPLPDRIPDLQISYSNAFGKANVEDDSDYNMHLLFLSFENPFITFTAQYYKGKGDTYGNYYFENSPFNNYGYSIFGEFRIPSTAFGVLSRYDDFTSEQLPDYQRTGFFYGASYRFLKNKVLLFYSRDFYPDNHKDILELAVEIAF